MMTMSKEKSATGKTVTMRLHHKTRANELFGATDTVTEDVLLEQDGGLLIEIRITGHIEGERINQFSSKFWPGGNLDKAIVGRKELGYVLVSNGSE